MKNNSEYGVVGKSKCRVDAIEKVTGKAKYTWDLNLPSMLHCKILRSPYPHAKIISIDTSKAEKLSGVRAILTPADVPDTLFNKAYRFSFPRDKYKFDERVLTRKSRFVGDRIAAVAADTEEIAEHAIKLIETKFDKLEPIMDPERAMEENAPKVHSESKNNIIQQLVVELGDVEKGFREADFVFEDKFKTHSQYHCALESHVSIADYGPNELTIWSSHQAPFQLRNMVSGVTGIPQHKIRVMNRYLGGGFGGKDEAFDELIAALLSKKSGRPVKVSTDRKEDVSATNRRHPSVITVKIGVKKDGALTALQIKSILDGGAYATCSARVLASNVGAPPLLYSVNNYKAEGFVVYTNRVPGGAFRGYGNPQWVFAVESMLDIVAEKLGIDSLVVRLKNAHGEGDPNYVTGGGIDSCGLERCLREGAEKINYYGRGKSVGAGGNIKRGIGIAMAVHPTSATPSGTEFWGALIAINPDGTVNLMVGTNEMGQGSNTVLAQIASEELGVNYDNISVISGDTNSNPQQVGSYASKTTHIAGNAVKLAAGDAKNKLLKEAAAVMDVSLKELVLSGNKISTKDGVKNISFSDLVRRIKDENIPQIIGVGVYKSETNAPSYAAHFAEVAVDTETGRVDVSKYVSMTDVGQAINPDLVEGQLEGGHHQGLGYALSEGLIWDEESGIVLNSNILDYGMIPPLDSPVMQIGLVTTVEPTGPFGAKGAGEISLDPVAPAIANAIYNAVGLRIKELPITPDKLILGLFEKERKDE